MQAKNVKALTLTALITLLLTAYGPLLRAEVTQDLLDIQATAVRFALSQLQNSVYSDVTVEAATLDPRMRKPLCDQELEAFSTNSGVRAGRTTVGVRCTGTSAWTLFIPLQIKASVNVVMLLAPLQRGAVLSEQDVRVASKPIDSLPAQYATDLKDILGKELTRNLGADTVLASHMLKEHPVISKGQEIVITASSPNFEVKMAGTALQSGARGERIAVKNNNSGRTIQAVIVDDNTVRVQL